MTNFIASLSIIAISSVVSVGQDFSANERLQGFAVGSDHATFVFDEAVYGIAPPTRVVVTGAFRAWSDDMGASEWQLRRNASGSGLWTLRIDGNRLDNLGPGVPFKYRINAGDWLAPPSEAMNEAGGNLIFDGAGRLFAELRGPRAIWLRLSGVDAPRSLDIEDYRLVNGAGVEIPIEAVIPNTATESLLVPAVDLDIRRVYYVESVDSGLRALCRRDPWFRTLYSSKPLGAEIASDGSETTFRLFAPRAQQVRLYLYLDAFATHSEAARVVEMTPDLNGVWEATEKGDHHGVYYDFRLSGPTDPGNAFFESTGSHVSDPYARVNVEAFGKSRVWRKVRPAPPLADGRPAMEDVIAYEVHVQDFTDGLNVPDNISGTLPAMVKPGVKNSRRAPVGFDYLVDLGVNVVHLMPVQEYLHYPNEEWRRAFMDDAYMKEQGINEENYQWGYRTTHAFAIETRYRSRDSDFGAQRQEFRDLVAAFHEKGIAVIIDIVPNHTGENMDGRNYNLNLNGIDKSYYFRTNDDLEHIGPFGNEIKTEDRPMVQRWIIDQCLHFVREFGIDGFRIDLAGQIDEQTLLRLKKELPEDIILYGEPWIAPSDPQVAANPDWAWYKSDAPITFFQDDARNAFKGPVSNPVDKRTDRGFAGGDSSVRDRVMLGLTNGFPEEMQPNRGINYLDIHDNWALADQFAVTDWDGRNGVHEVNFKIAATLLFTSLGPVVIHGGTEMMRSKGHAPLEEIVKRTESGPISIHGKRDTYNLRTANTFVWDNVGANSTDAGVANNYQSMIDYWKGLIALRKSSYGAVFRRGTEAPDGYYDWLPTTNEHLLGYIVDETVLVLINTDESPATFSVGELPAGMWTQVADSEIVNHVAGVPNVSPVNSSGGKHSFDVAGPGLEMWIRK